MLEIPGLSRAELLAMRPQTVAALRWGLFARALAPAVTLDLEGIAMSIDDAERPLDAARLAMRRGQARLRLADARKSQAAAREVLLLDEQDE